MSGRSEELCVLSPEELRVFAAAAERVLPGRRLPGASTLGVEGFLVRLLQQPKGRDTGRRLRDGLELLQSMARASEGEDFDRCDAAQRDDLLRRMQGIPHGVAQRFMATLVRVSVAAAFSHPAHGGNRGEAGWRWLGRRFPRRRVLSDGSQTLAGDVE